MKKRDDSICDNFSDIKDLLTSFVCDVLKMDCEDLDEKGFKIFSKNIEDVVNNNLKDKVEIFNQTVINQTSYNVITEKQINALLKSLKIKSDIFDKFIIQIGPLLEQEKGSGEYSGILSCDFGKELRNYFTFMCLQNFCELGEISPLCVDELKADVQEIEDEQQEDSFF